MISCLVVGFYYYPRAVTEHLRGTVLDHGGLDAQTDHRVGTPCLGIFHEAIDRLRASASIFVYSWISPPATLRRMAMTSFLKGSFQLYCGSVAEHLSSSLHHHRRLKADRDHRVCTQGLSLFNHAVYRLLPRFSEQLAVLVDFSTNKVSKKSHEILSCVSCPN